MMKKESKRKVIYFLIYTILAILITLSIIYIINIFLDKKQAIQESKLLDKIEINENQVNETTTEETVNESTQENIEGTINQENERILKVQKLQEENPDIVGWLEIEGTSINYPVLQGDDNEYYMAHNYKKQKSKNGSIFLTKDYDWSIPSSNLLIYGHNLSNGTMFQELLKYEKEDFYKKHPIIRFTTNNEDAEYEIISAFKSRVYYKSEKNVFRYYYFVNAKTEAEYNEFVQNAKKASLYNIDKTAQYGEQLITLSTCSYHVEDGRFAVVGRKTTK